MMFSELYGCGYSTSSYIKYPFYGCKYSEIQLESIFTDAVNELDYALVNFMLQNKAVSLDGDAYLSAVRHIAETNEERLFRVVLNSDFPLSGLLNNIASMGNIEFFRYVFASYRDSISEEMFAEVFQLSAANSCCNIITFLAKMDVLSDPYPSLLIATVNGDVQTFKCIMDTGISVDAHHIYKYKQIAHKDGNTELEDMTLKYMGKQPYCTYNCDIGIGE